LIEDKVKKIKKNGNFLNGDRRRLDEKEVVGSMQQ